MTEFRCEGWFEVNGTGWEAAVSLDRDTHDFAHLLDRGVHIDGTFYHCIGVLPSSRRMRPQRPANPLINAAQSTCAITQETHLPAEVCFPYASRDST
jgi:hypothetical protein